MNTVSQNQIIGIDVSRDWLDIHCLPNDHRLRIANTAQGHEKLVGIAHDRRALGGRATSGLAAIAPKGSPFQAGRTPACPSGRHDVQTRQAVHLR
jgi:hypothetical protein